MYPYISGSQKLQHEIYAGKRVERQSNDIDDGFTDCYEEIINLDDFEKLVVQEFYDHKPEYEHRHGPEHERRPEPEHHHRPEPEHHHNPGPEPNPRHDLPPGPYPGPRDTWSKPPAYRPPAFTPLRDKNLLFADPVSMKRCEGKLVYIWYWNGKDGWMYLSRVGRSTVTGYAWTPLGWAYTGFDLNAVEGFYCFG